MRKTALHLGCGGIYKQRTEDFEWINIDIFDGEGKVDRIFDLSKPLDFDSNSVALIEGYHIFEHLPYSSIEIIVESWYRVLENGGKIILEMPDFDGLIERLSKDPNNEQTLKYVFGSQERDGQYHHWGWNKTRLEKLLIGIGFKNIQFPPPQDYHKEEAPCLRVEAEK